jgi:hypothetical protein
VGKTELQGRKVGIPSLLLVPFRTQVGRRKSGLKTEIKSSLVSGGEGRGNSDPKELEQLRKLLTGGLSFEIQTINLRGHWRNRAHHRFCGNETPNKTFQGLLFCDLLLC